MKTLRSLAFAIILLAILVTPVLSEDVQTSKDNEKVTGFKKESSAIEQGKESNSFIAVLLYLPNRILDITDIFRVRVRVGPGIAAGVRITDAADLYMGSYVSMYAGLPGPRGRKLPRSPIGAESYNGAEISFAEATTGFGFGPDYAFSEVGLDAQIALVGFALSIDPVELVDFIVGIFTIDIMNDDYHD